VYNLFFTEPMNINPHQPFLSTLINLYQPHQPFLSTSSTLFPHPNPPLPAILPPLRKKILSIGMVWGYLRPSFLIVCFDFPTAVLLAVGFFLKI